MNFSPRSLAFRVVGFSTFLAIAALVVIATIISALYQNRAESSFDSLLEAHLFNLIGAIGANEAGVLRGTPNLGDLEFSRPESGFYWEVQGASPAITGSLRSPSMTGAIDVVPVSLVPFDSGFQRFYNVQGLGGERLRVVETEYVLGTENQIARFRVMGNLSWLTEETEDFRQKIFLYLSLFGIGMIVINAGAILIGLRPLNRIREALSLVREGKADQLDGDFPPEIEPLADETNALIDNNRRIVERYRTQVGNLAHSLKTPLAVIINEGRSAGGKKGELVAEQAISMQKQIEHYLQRARMAAQRDSVVFRTPVLETLERMVRVVDKLNPDKEFRFTHEDIAPIFAGERQDLEEIAGNLLENAGKWAKSQVVVGLEQYDSDGRAWFSINIEDDGPGIPEDRAREAVKRGRRLDETKPGTGLGLSIVVELVSEYGGTLQLQSCEIGGLMATVRLPAGH